MRWKNARRSDNVEDRRGSGGGGKKMAIGGGGGILVVILALVFGGGDLGSLFGGLQQQLGGGTGTSAPLTEQEKELGRFIEAVLGYTEDVWDQAYPSLARGVRGAPQRYQHPKLVLFSGQVQSACGFASAAMGPFYCPGDHQIYIDLSFYEELKRKFQAPGDFAQAYVIAHEVGHHIQNLLGISDYVHRQKKRVSEAEYNQLSVRLELQADYLAGVWANRAEKQFKILERGDLEEGLRAASAIGDDKIQQRSRGYVVPESFTHGTAAQRVRWFRHGLESGDPRSHDPFKVPYDEL